MKEGEVSVNTVWRSLGESLESLFNHNKNDQVYTPRDMGLYKLRTEYLLF